MRSGFASALNPADYFTLALDDEIRRDGMPGSLCAFALELRQIPDMVTLSARIEEFAQRFPLVYASLQQRGKRFYWLPRNYAPQIFFVHDCPDAEEHTHFRQRILEELINRRETRVALTPLTFHLLRNKSASLFVLLWLHPLCDARGANLILQYLCCDDAEQRARFGVPATSSLIDTQLAKFSFWKKIGLFLKAKRYIQQIDGLQSILPMQANATPEKLRYSVQRLSTEDSTTVADLARRQVGLTGTSLYYIGCLMRALEKLNPHAPGDGYCATYAFNLRKQKALTPLFGNHIGGLFAQAPRSIVQDRAALFRYLKRQHTEVLRQQLDYAFLPLMWAGSWLSLPRYGKTLRQSYRTGTERSSFWFSDIGRPEIPGGALGGAEIAGMLHLCQVTNPPALAILSCTHEKRLNFTYNYVEPLILPAWIDQLQTAMLAELLDTSCC
ncbi:MAG: hypothetical protein ACU837_10845 [Gammaproteobacteria bacterium]